MTGASDDCYYHPFSKPHGFDQISLFAEWLDNRADVPFAHAVGIQPTLCDQKRGPKQADMAEYASVENYGYHLDAHKFAQMLSEHCTRELGVRHLQADICGVNSAENGDILSLSMVGTPGSRLPMPIFSEWLRITHFFSGAIRRSANTYVSRS